MRKFLAAAVLGVGLSAGGQAQGVGPDVVHDLAADFSSTANPNGVWSYGWKSSLGGSFELLSFPGTYPLENAVPVRGWSLASLAYPPLVQHNGTAQTGLHDSGQCVWPPGTVIFTAGYDGTPKNFGVIRFTVPSDQGGMYLLESAVRSYLDGTRSGDADYHVVVNGGEVFGSFLLPCSAGGYTNLLSLAVGDTVDFVVGRGADGHLSGSGLKIQARLSHPAIPAVHRAAARVEVVNGFVVGFVITDPGYGYSASEPPAIRLSDVAGTGATAHAVVENGQVVRIEIDTNGRDYTGNTEVLIAKPPAQPAIAITVSRVTVRMSVVLGRKYQLDTSADMQTWTPSGDPFVAEAEEITQELPVTETQRFFRVREVP